MLGEVDWILHRKSQSKGSVRMCPTWGTAWTYHSCETDKLVSSSLECARDRDHVIPELYADVVRLGQAHVETVYQGRLR